MWHTTRLAAFDLETTGVDVEQDRIVTAAVIGLGGNASTEQHEWIADPGIEIPAEATAVHHITTEYAREHGKPAHVVVDQIAEELVAQIVMGEATIVGHNVPYDLTLLDRECRRYDLPTLHDRLAHTPLHVLDTRVLDQYGLPYRKRPSKEQGARQLITLAQVYQLPWEESEAHGCAYDALMSARIAYRIGTLAHMRRMDWPERIKHHRKAQLHHLGGLTVAELHAAQIEWAAQQAAGLQEHFRKTDPAAVVDGSWPLRPLEASCASN
ncbi:exonuclease domain-containing protein [Streptomyces cyaneofuscatus]|uniref:exonuclease domain-containing protein n=1 Tax=Streptomyces cyaneofuscatus TaxID=66883 RepID=UPI0013DAAF9C|nr:exonuclease domain-containing protein [Streptomyces cyaneofuscatus]NDZ63605.1 DNA polymerase III subunit epsilon [Streptomyces cyaneofuscatus]